MSRATQPVCPEPAVPLVEVVIRGELDLAAVARVRAVLDEALELHPRELVLDLSDCPLIDAAGIALLLDVHRRAWRADGRLRLRSPSPRVQRTLEIARVAHVLQVVEDRAGRATAPVPRLDVAPRRAAPDVARSA